MIPSPSSSLATTATPNRASIPVDFSPTLIAMVVVAAAAFLAITYSRNLIILVRRCRRRRRQYALPSQSSLSNVESPPRLEHVYSPWPYGLDESVIKTIPLSSYNQKQYGDVVERECAVCLVEFEEKEYVRRLPACSHAFHVDCIDIWLRSHANCPLCRSRIFLPEYSARIRPSLHHHLLLDYSPTYYTSAAAATTTSSSAPVAATANIATTTDTCNTPSEITPCCIEEEEEEPSSRRNAHSFDYGNSNSNRRRILLKRSYSFGFERSGFLAASERMLVTEPATASPWRFRRGVFWYKQRQPHLMMSTTPFKTARVFSFRHHHRASGSGSGSGVKSPSFFRRRRSSGGLGFYPLSESFSNLGSAGGSWRRRRSRSMASPMFLERLRFGEWC